MYIHEINLKLNKLKPTLIEAFVTFYGKSYRDRIDSVINSITFVYMSKNNNYYLGSSNDERINATILNKIKNISEVDGACLHHTQPPVIILSIDNGIIIRNLLHEINHALHNKEIKNNNNFFDNPMFNSYIPSNFQEGITNIDFNIDDSFENLTYEIINEYMSKEVFNIFSKMNNDQTLNCKYKIHEYTSLDNACKNIVKNIYLKFKTFIKEKLITADGQKIRDAIGKSNYKSLNEILSKLFNEYNSFIVRNKFNKSEMFENLTLDDEFDLLEKNFFIYLNKNNNSLLKQLEELETKILISIDEYSIVNNIICDTPIKKGKD